MRTWIVLPFAWVVLTSLMTEVESLSKPPHWIPDYITFDNYLAFVNPAMLGNQQLTGGGAAQDVRGGQLRGQARLEQEPITRLDLESRRRYGVSRITGEVAAAREP